MSYIPNTREKTIVSPYSGQRTKNGYWQGYLNKRDADIVRGWDFAVEDMMWILKELNGTEYVFEEIGISWSDIDGKAISSDRALDSYTKEELKTMDVATKVAIAIKEFLKSMMEINRDELIVSFIDSMDDAEYEEIEKAADAGTYDNGLGKESDGERECTDC